MEGEAGSSGYKNCNCGGHLPFASMFINIINVLPAGISAILCMHESVHESIPRRVETGLYHSDRCRVTGVLVVSLYQLKMSNYLLTLYTFAGILLTIYICRLFNMCHMSALGACITFFAGHRYLPGRGTVLPGLFKSRCNTFWYSDHSCGKPADTCKK